MSSKFVSIDIETTGLSFYNCQILSIGAVIDDLVNPFEERPTIHMHLVENLYTGEPFALQMNSEILKHHADVLQDESKKRPDIIYIPANRVYDIFYPWVREYIPEGKIPVAGKNYAGFDSQFLGRLPGWKLIEFHHRILDPAMVYWDPEVDGSLPPNLETCLERAGMDSVVTHDAVDDAQQVADLIMFAKDKNVI